MVVITSNNKYRDLLDGSHVPKKVIEDFFNSSGLTEDDYGFFKVYGTWYHACDFISLSCPAVSNKESFFEGWDAILSLSAFSGIVIAIDENAGMIKTGYYKEIS